MAAWQRRLRVAIGVFVILFAAGVYLTMRKQAGHRPAPPPAPVSSSPDKKSPLLQVGRGRFLVMKGAAVDCTIDYEAVLEYAGDATKIRGVRAKFPQRDGRDLEVTGDQASVTQDQSNFVISGNVRFATSDGLVMNTADASYTKAEGIVRAPGKVDFTKGTMRGSGVGMTYDQKADILSLLDKFEMTLEEDKGQPATEVHAGTGIWARADKTMRFEKDAKVVRRGQTLEADVTMAYLTADEQRVQTIQMQGSSRISGSPTTGAAAAASSLRGMRARDINLTYGPDGQSLQQAALVGTSSVEVASSAGAVTRIAGEFVDFALEPDGATMRSLAARGANAAARAELVLPADGQTPPRVIRAVSIQGPSPGIPVQPGRGLSSMRFTGNVEYREMPKAPAAPRTATSRVLDVRMQPGFGSLEEARFSGAVQVKQGATLETNSRDAAYNVKAGSFDLTGNDDKGAPPQVKEEQTTIQANHVVVIPDSKRVYADGNVQAALLPDQKRSDGTSSHPPAILKADEPTKAIAEQLAYDGVRNRARFTSTTPKAQSRLWQSSGTAIFARQIEIDDTTGNLTAGGSVVSIMMLEQVDEKTKRKEQVSRTVRADNLDYVDAARRAIYTGHVQIGAGPQGNAPNADTSTMKADKAVLNLDSDGRSLKTLEVFGNVEMQDEGTATSGARRATGDQLLYVASDESYLITGKLVKIEEKCSGESQGSRLQFWKSVDRMVIDGKDERRTQTKGGQGCKK